MVIFPDTLCTHSWSDSLLREEPFKSVCTHTQAGAMMPLCPGLVMKENLDLNKKKKKNFNMLAARPAHQAQIGVKGHSFTQ